MDNTSANGWFCCELTISVELEDSILWKLTQLGISQVAVALSQESPSARTILVWLPVDQWSEVDRDRLIECFTPLARTFGQTLPSPIWRRVENEDWNLSWKKHWFPDPVGSRLLILPAWLEAPEEHADRIVIRLDPGSAFGTGSHPTTRMCLEALENNPPLGLRIADLGCGSGVLGLAALGLGAREVLAVDIDALAVRATSENSILNNSYARKLRVWLGSAETLQNELRGEQVDLLLCNIISSTIEALAPQFDQLLAPTGRALLSGLLTEELPGLQSLLESLSWRVLTSAEQDRWGLIEICRAHS